MATKQDNIVNYYPYQHSPKWEEVEKIKTQDGKMCKHFYRVKGTKACINCKFNRVLTIDTNDMTPKSMGCVANSWKKHFGAQVYKDVSLSRKTWCEDAGLGQISEHLIQQLRDDRKRKLK